MPLNSGQRRLFVCCIPVAFVAFLAAPLPAADWSQFRGPNGQGRSDRTDLPVKWSERDGVIWKESVPGSGWSSPVIEGNSIWLTTAEKEGHSLRALCYAADTGQLRRNVEIFAPANPVTINPKNTFASPSAIVEAGRIYVHFGAMGTACLNTSTGDIVWRNENLVIDHKEGPGSSPILFEDLLIVNCDGQDQQYVAGLYKRDGKVAWKTTRSVPFTGVRPDFRKAFSTPALIEVGGNPQVVCTGANQVNAYNPRTGKEIWHVRYSGFSNIPIPIVDQGHVMVVTDFLRPQLWSIRCDSHGDVTDTNVSWKLPRQVGASPTGVLFNHRIYLVTDQGVATCVDSQTGKPRWQQRFGGTFSTSVLALGGRIYFTSEQGKTTVIQPADECRIVASNQLDGRILATPAVLGPALVFRTDTHLYRIESTSATAARSAAGARRTN